MKIALVCTAAGYAYRGLERFTSELFDLLKGDLSITLFGSNSQGKQGAVGLPCFKSDRWSHLFKEKNYYAQQLSYSFSFIPLVIGQGYDIVHYSEPGMGNFLYHAKKWFKPKYKILFTNWGMEGSYCLRPDHLQEITSPAYDKTINYGIPKNKVSFIPYGLRTENFTVSYDRPALREKYGIPKDKFVILSVAALNRRHKRIDYLIRETSRLGNDFFLLVVGHPEEPDLNQLGENLLGQNFKSLYIPFDQMPEIYQLADLFVIPSLAEGFCLALVEAMCSGLPVIANDTSIFQWVVGEPRCLADLSKEGILVQKIREMATNYDSFKKIAEKNRARAIERFDWSHLKKDYVHLYERVLAGL